MDARKRRLFMEWNMVWKTALASGIAWEVARLTGTQRPYFAPLAAILCLQVTVEESVWQGYQRVLGIIGGVLLADGLVRLIGISAWSVALLVLAGTGMAKLLRFGKKAVPQVGISAMMVLTVGGGHYSYSLDRISDTVLGAVISIVINAVVVPPDYTPMAAASVETAKRELAERLRTVVQWLRQGADVEAGRRLQEETRTYVEKLHETVTRVEQALKALHYSPLVKHRRGRLDTLHKDLLHLRQGYAHMTGMVRTLIDRVDDDVTVTSKELAAWADRIEILADDVAEAGHHQSLGARLPAERLTPQRSASGSAVSDRRLRFTGALWNDYEQMKADMADWRNADTGSV